MNDKTKSVSYFLLQETSIYVILWVILDLPAPICAHWSKCWYPNVGILPDRSKSEKHTRPRQMTKAHAAGRSHTRLGSDYKAAWSLLPEEFRCQTCMGFIYFSKSVICHSAHQLFMGIIAFSLPQRCSEQQCTLGTDIPRDAPGSRQQWPGRWALPKHQSPKILG